MSLCPSRKTGGIGTCAHDRVWFLGSVPQSPTYTGVSIIPEGYKIRVGYIFLPIGVYYGRKFLTTWPILANFGGKYYR
jgi:hypothetical protein